MHELFTNVLSKRDLSRAGELFSVADSEIENDLNEVLTKLDAIISNPDYLQNKNDQSVVEICITRITSCIRETKTAERHCVGLVALLESCLAFNLHPTGKNEDPPHAKICADIISSVFLNYNKKTVMDVALPVAVKFLEKGNKELARNLASYLSLAAIDHAYLLSSHVQLILDSVLAGNFGLCRALPQIYKVSPDPLTLQAAALVALLPKCDVQEKLALLNLFELIAKNKPNVLEKSIPDLCNLLSDSATASATMLVLLKMAETRPHLVFTQSDKIRSSAIMFPSTVSLAAKILSAAGKTNKERAQFALDFILEQLQLTDRSSQNILMTEATKLCSTYPILFTDKFLACIRKRNNMNQKSGGTSQSATTESNRNQTTSGGVTIVKLNSPSQVLETNPTSSTSVQKSQVPTPLVTTTVINTMNGSASSSNNVVQSPQMSTLNSSQIHNNHNSNNQNGYGQRPGGGTSSAHLILSTGQLAQYPNQHQHSHHHQTTTNAISNPVDHKTNGGTSNQTSAAINSVVSPTPTHNGYTRRAKLGDSRSTGRLHPGGNTHRSMTRLNIAGGSVGGLHKSMTRLSSSQQINQQNGSNSQNMNGNSSGSMTQGNNSQNYVTPKPPLSSNVVVTGHNKWGIPSTKITSGGVTVTTSPSRIRPHSQGPGVLGMGSSGALGKGSSHGLNQSSGSLGFQQNPVSVHHASPASPTFDGQQPVMTLPVNSLSNSSHNQVSISGPLTVTSRRNDNTSVTLLNANNTQRMSVFEPYPMRDTIQHFCEKHLDKIKTYMKGVSQCLPPPAKCTIEERRSKKLAKLHFACQARGPHCLYSKTFFTMRTRNPRTWIHLMFLDLQSREQNALSSRDLGVSSLRHCWDILKCENKTFMTLVTSAFPVQKDQDTLVNELRNSGFFDVFELGSINCSNDTISTDELQLQWGCFLCNHPEKAMGFLHGNTQPVIEGQLKEKKGKWRLFRRWRTRYFTLSGAHLSCKGSSGGESIDINQIRSVKVSRGARNIPKAFEIFTGDQTLILKPKDGKNAEEWVQYLSIVVAHSQARDTPAAKTNSLPARGLGNSRNAF